MLYSDYNEEWIWEIGKQVPEKSYFSHTYYKDAQGNEIIMFSEDDETAIYFHNGVAFGEGEFPRVHKIRVYKEFMNREVK